MTIDELKIKYANELAVIIELLEITTDIDFVKEMSILLAIDAAYKNILKYTGWDIFNTDYIGTVYSLAIAYYNNDSVNKNSAVGKRAITQKTDGSRSRTYAKATIELDRNGLIPEVKAILPLPKLRCL